MAFSFSKSLGIALCVCFIVHPEKSFTQAQKLATTATAQITASDAHLQYSGRTDRSRAGQVRMAYPGTSVAFRFEGTSAALYVATDRAMTWVAIIVDHREPRIVNLPPGEGVLKVAEDLPAGEHRVQVVKRTESWQGIITVEGVTLSDGGALLDPPPLPARKLLFIGDSVTCGAGVDNYPVCMKDPARPSNAWDSYGMVLARRLDAQAQLVCFGGRGVIRDYLGRNDVLNAPQFFEYTIPAEAQDHPVKWTPDNWVPNGIVVSVGTNDFNLQASKPIDEAQFVQVYKDFLQRIHTVYPKAAVFLTEGSIVTIPLLRTLVRRVVDETGAPWVSWVPAQHYSGCELNSHPVKPQHELMADDLEPALRKRLGW